MTIRVPLALAELLIGWLLLTSVGGRGDPWPVVGMVAIGVAAYLVAHLVPRRARPWVAGALGLTVLAVVLAAAGSLGDPLGGPLGYANANAALAAQAAGALAILGSASARPALLAGAAGVAVALAVTLAIGAFAASAAVALIAAALLAPSGRTRRIVTIITLGVAAAATALAFLTGISGGAGPGAEALSERRVNLWVDGVAALDEEPLLGAGSREFAAVSATAAGDADTREAHAEILQRAVENGAPGALLELAAVVIVLAGLTRQVWTSASRAAAVSVAAFAGLWANAGVDYVLSFPAVVALGCAVAGLGTSPFGWQRLLRRGRTASADRLSSPT